MAETPETMELEDGKGYAFRLKHLIAADGKAFAAIATTEPDGVEVSFGLPSDLGRWLAGNARLHRGRFWLRQTTVADGRKSVDIGLITPTLLVAEDAAGRRVYFEAFDAAHARDIIADHGLPGFDGHPLRLRKVKRLEQVPPEDRGLPVRSLLASGNRVRVAEYGDLNDPDRYDADDDESVVEDAPPPSPRM